MRRLIDSLRARFTGLRCRPGDLAIVVRACDHPQFPGVVLLKPGTVVRVVRISKSGLWELESVIPFRVIFGLTLLTGHIAAIADDLLRPLRDKPGEDETLTTLRAPRPQVKPAVSRPAVTQMRQAVESGAVGMHPRGSAGHACIGFRSPDRVITNDNEFFGRP